MSMETSIRSSAGFERQRTNFSPSFVINLQRRPETHTSHSFSQKTCQQRSDISKHFTSKSKSLLTNFLGKNEQTTATTARNCLCEERDGNKGVGGKMLALSDILWSWCNQPDNSHEKSLQRNTHWLILYLKMS